MPKKITIWRSDFDHTWRIALENSPVMGSAVWQYDTWAECMMHANVLTQVWDHL